MANEITGKGFKETLKALAKDEKLIKMTEGLFCIAILGGPNQIGEARIMLDFSNDKILAEKRALADAIAKQTETKNEKDNIPSA